MAKDGEVAHSFQPLMGVSRSFFWGLMEAKWPIRRSRPIFDKFVQSSKTRTGAGSTGLGLPICREIMTAHRGSIRAENSPEGGAIFRVELPPLPS